ncbi:hypothetical protein PCAR4_350076 [Paraburkholderia caribensis]|nr:hypothetical protein PBP221_83240 [Paraburkholderia sp. 22B1P]GJH37601.1 hypothetical protein CBA19CS91_32610 [Paraburkholderia hospita]CAG9253677.1 hypothetical protein PCAR4_350076 [Paraburkholderia caribensis]
MNKYQVKGVAEKVKGNVNQAVGKATDDPARELTGSAGGRGSSPEVLRRRQGSSERCG